MSTRPNQTLIVAPYVTLKRLKSYSMASGKRPSQQPVNATPILGPVKCPAKRCCGRPTHIDHVPQSGLPCRKHNCTWWFASTAAAIHVSACQNPQPDQRLTLLHLDGIDLPQLAQPIERNVPKLTQMPAQHQIAAENWNIKCHFQRRDHVQRAQVGTG